MKTNMITNGLLLTEKNVDFLLNHPPNLLRISVQALTQEHHAATRGTPEKFDVYIDRVAKCLARLIDNKHDIDEVRTDIAVNDKRYAGVSGIVKFIKEMTGASGRGDPTIFNQTPKNLQLAMTHFLKKIEHASDSFQLSTEHLKECTEKYYSSGEQNLWDTAYELAPNNSITYKSFFNGRKFTQYYPVNQGVCGSQIIGILADGTVTCCCIDYEGFTGIGNIFSDNLINILERNKEILNGIHNTGVLHFDTCKVCLGSPTKFGALLKGTINRLRFLRARKSRNDDFIPRANI